MTLSTTERDVLAALSAGPRYGSEVGEAAGISRGSLYVVLSCMEGDGWLRSWREASQANADPVLARRHYELTDAGRIALGLGVPR